MARRVALFRAERRTEGVNAAERHCMSFNVKLTAYGKIGGFSEKVLRIVNLAVGRFRKIIGVKRGNAEHFSRALTVARCDNRGMNINKSALIKECVDGICQNASHTENSRKGIRSGAQMRNCSEIFIRMAFFLKRIIGS